jgi:hypothetical protein
MHLCLPINPLRVPELARKRKLEHLFQSAVSCILLIRHHNRNIRLNSASQVPPRSKILILRHRRIDTVPRVSSTPLDITSRLN